MASYDTNEQSHNAKETLLYVSRRRNFEEILKDHGILRTYLGATYKKLQDIEMTQRCYGTSRKKRTNQTTFSKKSHSHQES